MSNAERSRYTRLEPVIEGRCFYCPAHPFMDDTTPSHKATAIARASFQGEWVIVKVCKVCWHKIYAANWVNGAAGFGNVPGLMTLENKRTVLGLGTPSELNKVVGYSFNRDQTLILPVDATIADESEFFINGLRFNLDEIEMLQGPMSLRMHGLRDYIVERAFRAAMAEGTLEIPREMAYRIMLKLDQSEDAIF